MCYANVCGGVNMYLALVHVPGALVEVRVGSELSNGTQHRLLVQFQVSRELDSE